MYKVGVYIPFSHLEIVKGAMFAAGAGRIGNYDSCAWQCLGTGQFRPLEGSDAFIGKMGKVETVEEYRVEMVVADDLMRTVIEAMKAAHPYETPAYDVIRLENI